MRCTPTRGMKGIVAGRIEQHGFTTFLPTVKALHRWSDRRKVVELPLFSC